MIQELVFMNFVYILFLNNQLSQEIMNLFGDTPELYGQFTSLDIQRDIELNIPFKYHYQYKLLIKKLILMKRNGGELKVQPFAIFL